MSFILGFLAWVAFVVVVTFVIIAAGIFELTVGVFGFIGVAILIGLAVLAFRGSRRGRYDDRW